MKALRGFLALSLIVGGASLASAHEPPGEVYYAFGWPANAVPAVDGDISEWEIVPEEFWLTLENDMEETVRGIGTDFDLADFNMREVISWNDETNRVYSVCDVVDDYLHNSREEHANYNWDDEWHFVLDADHSGGDLFNGDWGALPEEERRQLYYTTGQLYSMLVPPLSGYWNFMYIEATGWWMHDGQSILTPEYQEMGWARTGENLGPGTYKYEMKVTPWQHLDWTGPAASVEVDLEEGLIIHIGTLYKDYDVSDSYEGSYDFPPIHNVWRNANLLGDFELLAVDTELFPPGTAVESDTWGRIKAQMLTE